MFNIENWFLVATATNRVEFACSQLSNKKFKNSLNKSRIIIADDDRHKSTERFCYIKIVSFIYKFNNTYIYIL